MRVYYFKLRSILQSLCDSTNLEIHYPPEEGGVSVSIRGRNSPFVSRHRIAIAVTHLLREREGSSAVLLTNGKYTLLLSEEEEGELENAVCIPVPSLLILKNREGLFPCPAWIPAFIQERRIVYATFPDAFKGFDEEGAPLFKEKYVSRVGEIILKDTRPSCQAGCTMLFLEDECCRVVMPAKEKVIQEGEKVKIKEIMSDVWLFTEKYLPRIREFMEKYGYVVRRTLRISNEEVWYEREDNGEGTK